MSFDYLCKYCLFNAFLFQLNACCMFTPGRCLKIRVMLTHLDASKMEICTFFCLTWESAVWRGMFCQLVFGRWVCTPRCKSTWQCSHDVKFFALKEQDDMSSSYVSCMMCYACCACDKMSKKKKFTAIVDHFMCWRQEGKEMANAFFHMLNLEPWR